MTTGTSLSKAEMSFCMTKDFHKERCKVIKRKEVWTTKAPDFSGESCFKVKEGAPVWERAEGRLEKFLPFVLEQGGKKVEVHAVVSMGSMPLGGICREGKGS